MKRIGVLLTLLTLLASSSLVLGDYTTQYNILRARLRRVNRLVSGQGFPFDGPPPGGPPFGEPPSGGPPGLVPPVIKMKLQELITLCPIGSPTGAFCYPDDDDTDADTTEPGMPEKPEIDIPHNSGFCYIQIRIILNRGWASFLRVFQSRTLAKVMMNPEHSPQFPRFLLIK